MAFTISPATTAEGKRRMEEYGLRGSSHGLVGIDAGGSVKVMIKGHDFTRGDVVQKVEELLR